jgi:hypothetical protein
MKIFQLSVTVLVFNALASGFVIGQNPAPPRTAGERPPAAPASQALTAAELSTINTVLAPYKPASLTAEDAKKIKRTLRDAGLRRSRELDAALNAAGFSPDKLDALDPPPLRPAGEGAASPPPPKK